MPSRLLVRFLVLALLVLGCLFPLAVTACDSGSCSRRLDSCVPGALAQTSSGNFCDYRDCYSSYRDCLERSGCSRSDREWRYADSEYNMANSRCR